MSGRRILLVGANLCLFTSLTCGAEPAVPVNGKIGPGLEHFDEMMLETLARFDVPGGALSIVKDGRLVLARGYGWAHIAGKEPVRPVQLFGVASISKSITAVTVLKMVEEGKFGLDDPILKLLGPIKPPPEMKENPRWQRITVRMLLHHAGGWDREKSGDPTLWSGRAAKALRVEKPITRMQLIRYVLCQPLDFEPGTQSRYSNFGFTVLGAIIEQVSGKPYGEYVQEQTLEPIGIRQARLGEPGETYAKNAAHRYNAEWKEIPPMQGGVGDPAGGWQFSVVELAEFLCAVDGSRGRSFLSKGMMEEMLAAPKPPLKTRPAGGYFGLGWDTVIPGPKGFSYSKNGGLSGAHSFFGHLESGVNWAVVFNGDGTKPNGFANLDAYAARHVKTCVSETKEWPKEDFFDAFK